MSLDVVHALAFGTSITITAFAVRNCGRLNDVGPREVPLQPPDWVFGVVWPLLYITTGWAWFTAGARADVGMTLITVLCCAWLPAYLCLRSKSVAAAILIASVVATVVVAERLRSTPGWLLAPLALWLSFATYLNLYDVVRE